LTTTRPDSAVVYFFIVTPQPPRSTLFPYTTLFRSIVNEERKKLSKRDESIIQFITQYKDLGYLPEAMFNFFALLGWSPVGEEERSEEHTSELQSRENLVCRLLLEKKNV